MEIAVVALLALLNVQFGLAWWLSKESTTNVTVSVPEPAPKAAPKPTPKPAPAPKPVDPAVQARDERVHALIQAVDPSWSPGDPREHIELVPGADGEIVEARNAAQ